MIFPLFLPGYLPLSPGPAHFFVVGLGERQAVVVDPLGTAAACRLAGALLRADVRDSFPVLAKSTQLHLGTGFCTHFGDHFLASN
jgi:hypothetical protein